MRHGSIIENAVNSTPHLPPFAGTLVRGAIPALPSRHLGLVSADTEFLSSKLIAELAESVEEAFDS